MGPESGAPFSSVPLITPCKPLTLSVHGNLGCATINAARFHIALRQDRDPGGTSGDTIMLDNLFTPTHLIIILVIALLIFGPRKLPELGKGLGGGLKGFKDGIKGNPDAPKQQENIAKNETPQPPAATQVK